MSSRTDPLPAANARAAPSPEAAANIADVYQIVIGRPRLLIPCLAIAFAVALGYILLTPTRYTATMSILVDPRERAPVGTEGQPLPQTPDIGLVESQMRVLTSQAVLRRVVEAEDLVDDPDFRPGPIGQIIEAATALLRSHAPTREDRIDATARLLGEEVSTKRSERTYIIDVDVKAGTREKSVRLADALASAYLKDRSTLADAIVARQSAWLDERLNDLRPRVEQAERRAQDYRDHNAIALSDGRLSPEQQLASANAALVAARNKRAETEARLDQLKAAMAHGGGPEAIGDAIHSPVIEKLRADYAALSRDEAYERTLLGPSHPTYLVTQAQLRATQSQISAEMQRILGAAERELKTDRDAERGAEKIVANAEVSTNDLGDRRIGLSDLEREATALRAAYDKLRTARENVRRDIVDSPLAQVVDPPVASVGRTSPRTTPALLIALAAGINLWIVAALLSDWRDRAGPRPSGTPGGWAGRFGLARRRKGWFVVKIPSFPSVARASETSRRGRSDAAEAMIAVNAMRANGAYASAIASLLARVVGDGVSAAGAPRLAVAARAPGAGASSLALSLALAARATGQRVLLADCNGDHPSLTALADALAPVSRERALGGARIFGRDGAGAGEIIVLPFAEPDEAGPRPPAGAFDLIILDCGALDAAAYLVNNWGAADKVIVVERDGEDEAGVASDIEGADLAGKCAGVVLTPDADVVRKRA